MTVARLSFGDRWRVASVGVRNRPLRSLLSALGIAIGVAAIVAVLGLSAPSQAGLLAEIDRLGTNLLTASAGQSFTGQDAQLPLDASVRISHLAAVGQIAHTAIVPGANVYRNPLVPSINTNALKVRAADLDLLPVIATTVVQGRWLNPATAAQPVAVLGADAAKRLGVSRIYPGERIWLANHTHRSPAYGLKTQRRPVELVRHTAARPLIYVP